MDVGTLYTKTYMGLIIVKYRSKNKTKQRDKSKDSDETLTKRRAERKIFRST